MGIINLIQKFWTLKFCIISSWKYAEAQITSFELFTPKYFKNIFLICIKYREREREREFKQMQKIPESDITEVL